jgi:cell division protein FtsL
MKLAFAIVLCIVVVLVGIQVFSFLGQQRALNQNLSDVQTRLVQAQSQEANLQAETQYLANPANLEKELRAQFNYKNPGETMIIIVPAATPSSTTD